MLVLPFLTSKETTEIHWLMFISVCFWGSCSLALCISITIGRISFGGFFVCLFFLLVHFSFFAPFKWMHCPSSAFPTIWNVAFWKTLYSCFISSLFFFFSGFLPTLPYIYIYIREFCFSLILLAVKESQYVVVSFHLIFLWIYLYLLPFLVGYPSHLSLGRILSHRSFHLWLKSLTFYHCTIWAWQNDCWNEPVCWKSPDMSC